MLIYWFLFTLSVCALLGCILASVTMGGRFRTDDPLQMPLRVPLLSLSMIVPIKCADEEIAAHLNALIESDLDTPVEYLLAMESADDPAFGVCQAVKTHHPDMARQTISHSPSWDHQICESARGMILQIIQPFCFASKIDHRNIR